MQPRARYLHLALTLVLLQPLVTLHGAQESGVSGGLTLLNDASARGMALGGTLGTAKNDISSYSNNPAALASLENGHATLLYENGLTDDSFSQLSIGTPIKHGSLGFSLGYYDGGDFDLFDGTNRTNVTAQTDLLLSVGYANSVGMFSWGVAGKYISSELVEREKATAFAGDIGIAADANDRLRLGAALQNMGSKIEFVSSGDNLPRTLRGGASYLLVPHQVPTTVFLDIPYFINDSRIEGALGVESLFGPLALRIGYRSGNDVGGLTLGSGFKLGPAALDYAFGLIDDLDDQHRISLSLRFGNTMKLERASFSATPTFVFHNNQMTHRTVTP